MTNRTDPIRPLRDTDAYKLGHIHQYPVGTTGVLSNYTNRKSRIPRITHVVHFGLQAFLQEWAIDAFKPFFAASEDEVASLYEEFTTSVLGPNTIGTDHIRALHRLGYLPLVFRALPEGSLVPFRVPSFTVENTLPEFYWLVNYIETPMSASIWQASTSATTAHYFRTLLDSWAVKTTGSTEGVQWQGHDFSFRGMPGIWAASASGAGHLLSFTGSDNLNALNFIEDNYDGDNGLILGSVPATEHSVMCAGGSEPEEEEETYRRLLTEVVPTGIVSVVSDTWDLWRVLTEYMPNLKDLIMGREGKLVIRPDSGDPVKILTGTLDDTDPRARKGVIELLWDVFGGTEVIGGDGNTYKVLDSHIGAIYGDSITYDRAEEIFERLAAKGFASTNVVLGIGSFTYQYVTRDTFSSAVKATWVRINGEGKDIFKAPITDSGMKKSAKGRIVVAQKDGEFELMDGDLGRAFEGSEIDFLEEVWRDGKFVQRQTFDEVRQVLSLQRD